MRTLIKDAHVYSGHESGFAGGVLIENGIIAKVLHDEEITSMNMHDMQVISAEGKMLLPGMIDIHLHGSYGYDFIRTPQLSIDHVAKGLVQEGTTAFLASLTVVSHEVLCDLLQEYATIQQPKDSAAYLGVHSEGPYLSCAYKALMNEAYLRDPSMQEWEEMLEASKGWLKVMTIAPERLGAEVLIQGGHSIHFMIGHSAASCEEAMHAIHKGAKGFTYLYNAMSPHSHRNPGCVTAALLADEAYCELIVDGFHVHQEVVQATYKTIGAKRLVLITDAMLGKGMPDGDYVFSELDCHKQGNTVQVKATGRIAGSAITMLDAIKNMRRFTHCSIEEIVQMACVNPSVIAQIDPRKGSIKEGKDADLILLEDDLSLISTYVKGKEVYHC